MGRFSPRVIMAKQFTSKSVVRFRSRIQNTLLFYYLFPILVIFAVLGTYFYFSTEGLLDRELGQRLISVSNFAATQIKPYYLSSLKLQNPNNLTATSLKEKFNEMRQKNEIERIYLFDLQNQSLLDTDPNYQPGSIYQRNYIHRDEIQRAIQGNASPSLLFKNQNNLYMKSAFSPVMDQGKVIAILGVDGNATFFKSLRILERKLILSGLFCMLTIFLVSYFLSKRIVNPINQLVLAAKKIGDGDLDDSIQIRTANEIGFLGFVMDEMRKKIVERDQELQVMLRGIAHEVRNPLGGIELFSGILSEEVKDEKSKLAVSKIQKEVTNLKNLTEDFLNFARKPSLQIEEIDFNDFMDEIRLYFAQQIENSGISLNIHSTLKTFMADAYHLKRLLLNLIHNSIQAVNKTGAIDIEAHEENRQVQICVCDDGHGISQENLVKIFDPFFTTREYGNGLGLSFVQKIVQAHGGTIAAVSELNKGTKMIITLPKS